VGKRKTGGGEVNAAVKTEDRTIDVVAYELYGLTGEEIWVWRRLTDAVGLVGYVLTRFTSLSRSKPACNNIRIAYNIYENLRRESLKKLLGFLAVIVIALAAADTVVFQPGGGDENDAHVINLYPDVNFGPSPLLCVGANPNNDALIRTYLEFTDLDDYCGPGYEVNSAVLELYCIPYFGTVDEITINPCSSAFEENTITWNNKPSVYTGISVSFDYPDNEDPYDVDVTPIVSAWADGEYPHYGFRMRLEDESAWCGGWFGAGENQNEDYRPKLTLDYTDTSDVVPVSMGYVKALYQ
jgi:hypothetical protein